VITILNLSGDSISDMTGIAAFVNLSKLDCAFKLFPYQIKSPGLDMTFLQLPPDIRV
jgi:Leucine-rich repeat (LRR) protein